jgi:hypothetical protein
MVSYQRHLPVRPPIRPLFVSLAEGLWQSVRGYIDMLSSLANDSCQSTILWSFHDFSLKLVVEYRSGSHLSGRVL